MLVRTLGIGFLTCAVAAALLQVGCSGDGELRGAVTKSEDGGTYFGVDDDDGGGCGPIYVDGELWPHPLHSVAPIQPGKHTIKICTEMSFEVATGTTYRFDYWGP